MVTGVHQALRDSGPNLRDEESVRQWLGAEGRFCYLAPDGFLAYRWRHGNDELQVDRALAVSAATTRAIWGIVASHSSIASTVRACLGPADPVHWLTREPDVAPTGRVAWMLRVVNAPAAIAERGFPASAEVTASLRLADPVCPDNEGLWTLEVSGGKGALSRGPAGPARGPAARPLGPARAAWPRCTPGRRWPRCAGPGWSPTVTRPPMPGWTRCSRPPRSCSRRSDPVPPGRGPPRGTTRRGSSPGRPSRAGSVGRDRTRVRRAALRYGAAAGMERRCGCSAWTPG